MNERIKELAEQAGYYLYDLTETHECKTVETDSTDEWITLEKFAELIVRECRDIVEQDMKLAHIQMIPLTLEKYANGRLKEKIRERFGVEE
jgi:hypothetical protein